MLRLSASSIADTHAIAAAVASLARSGDTILLAGEMGAGKTAFAQGFGRALGVEEPITSPTYTLVHSYELPSAQRGARTLHHADLYRLDRTTEVAELALAELAEFGGIVLIEWGDIVESAFGDHLTVVLSLPDDDEPIDEAGAADPDADEADDAGDGNANDSEEPTDGEELNLDGRRRIELAAVGSSWAARWERLAWSVEQFE